MDILCTDKTGTLTEDKITLVKYVDGEGKDLDDVFLAAYVNSLVSGSFKSPLDSAIKDFKAVDISAYKKIDEIPFDFERKRDSIVVEKSQLHLLIAKGAPEQIVEICSFYDGEKKPIPNLRANILQEYERLSQDGFRVLGVAGKSDF